MKKTSLYLFTISTCISVNAFSQTQKIVADKVAAQIGNKIILRSDISRDAESDSLPGTRPDCALLEQQLVMKCLALEAVNDSIKISDEEVTAMIDQQFALFARNEEGVDHSSILQLKQNLFEAFKERRFAEAMREKILGNIAITPAEVKQYFESLAADSIPLMEGSLQGRQIVFYPKQSKAMDGYQVSQLLEWKHQVESGKQKFDVLARLYSQDPGSNTQGGIYNVNRNDRQWDAAWFNAIWKLKEGQVSPVVHSKYGFHIIQMVSRAGDDAIIRHILLLPQITSEDIAATKALSDSVRNAIVSGLITFNEAVFKFSEDEDGRNNAGQIVIYGGSPAITEDNTARTVLQNMREGDVSQPYVYKDALQRNAVSILYLEKKTLPHAANPATDYSAIAHQALEKKKERVLQQWLEAHMHDFYVNINDEFAQCSNAAQWASATGN